MMKLGSRVRYDGHDCVVVGRTIEARSKYDLLFPASRRIEQNVPEKDLEPYPIESRPTYLIQVRSSLLEPSPGD